MSVSVTAESVGFSSVSHFIDVFRKHTGMTPLAYKKKSGKGMKDARSWNTSKWVFSKQTTP